MVVGEKENKQLFKKLPVLPKQMTVEDIQKIADKIIHKGGVADMKNNLQRDKWLKEKPSPMWEGRFDQ